MFSFDVYLSISPLHFLPNSHQRLLSSFFFVCFFFTKLSNLQISGQCGSDWIHLQHPSPYCSISAPWVTTFPSYVSTLLPNHSIHIGPSQIFRYSFMVPPTRDFQPVASQQLPYMSHLNDSFLPLISGVIAQTPALHGCLAVYWLDTS